MRSRGRVQHLLAESVGLRAVLVDLIAPDLLVLAMHTIELLLLVAQCFASLLYLLQQLDLLACRLFKRCAHLPDLDLQLPDLRL